MLVLAGPGSGKTKGVLTVSYNLSLNTSQEKNFRILGLTFTNKAADEMRLRVANLVRVRKQIVFRYIHSFCADVLRQHKRTFRDQSNFQIYSQDFDLQAVLDDAVKEAKKESDIISDLDKRRCLSYKD